LASRNISTINANAPSIQSARITQIFIANLLQGVVYTPFFWIPASGYTVYMARFKEGDRVRVKGRNASEQEVLEGRYAPFMAGATGTILKIYDSKQIAVNLDIASLPEEVRQRHAEQQETMHRRWLDSLSEEARNRLTDQEKAFHLNYVVLLTESDLEPFGGRPARQVQTSPDRPSPTRKEGGKKGRSATPSAKAPQKAKGTAKGQQPTPSPKPSPKKSEGGKREQAKAPSAAAPARPTPQQLDLMEEAYLKARQRKAR
jgi:ribosomal protein L21E